MEPPIFAFKQPLEKGDVLLAISQIEEKGWSKRKDAAAQAGQTFDEAQPMLEGIRAQYEGRSAEETLMSYATNGRLDAIPEQAQVMAALEAKNIGAVLLQLEKNNEAPDKMHPQVKLQGSDDKEYELEPKEISAWLQANAKAGFNIPVNEWAQANRVGLTSHGDMVRSAEDTLYIETRDGERRTVGNGNLTEPIKGNYGAIRGLKVADGDDVDVYISNEAMQHIKGGNAYNGKVFVMQQMDKGKDDELKLGFAKDADEFKSIMTSTWKDGRDFEKLNEGKYAELTQQQYRELKDDIRKNPRLTLEEFSGERAIEMRSFERISDEQTGTDKKVVQLEIPEGLKGMSAEQLAAAVGAVEGNMAAIHAGMQPASYGASNVALVPGTGNNNQLG